MADRENQLHDIDPERTPPVEAIAAMAPPAETWAVELGFVQKLGASYKSEITDLRRDLEAARGEVDAWRNRSIVAAHFAVEIADHAERCAVVSTPAYDLAVQKVRTLRGCDTPIPGLTAERDRLKADLAAAHRTREGQLASLNRVRSQLAADNRRLTENLVRVTAERDARGAELAHGAYLVKAARESLAGPGGLGLDQLRLSNVARCEAVFHPLASWSACEWACAMAGEAGEVCNAVKKLRRLADGTNTAKDPQTEVAAVEAIGKELADTIIYADLLAARLGIDLSDAVRQKFNEVSERTRSTVML